MAMQSRCSPTVEGEESSVNRAADGMSFYTPAQSPPAGTALVAADQTSVPKLFRPLKLRGMTMQNRIMLSPLGQCSADDGHLTMWHLTHMGGIVQRGPGLSTVEATSVTPNGRTSPEDSGLWKDSQIEPLRKIVEFAHSQGQKIMIQLCHAGRKASTIAPWLPNGGGIATEELNGWPDDIYGPSAIRWDDRHSSPREMTLEDITDLKQAWVAATERAMKAGFDAVEIHAAHGYLLHSFLSPVANHRVDHYGGFFDNRARLLLEIVRDSRRVIPDDMPLFVRVSGSDLLEEIPKDVIPETWTVEDNVALAYELADAGVDVLDVSAGGNSPLQHPHVKPAYQAPLAIRVKQAVGKKLAVATVGCIDSATLANDLLENDGLDIVAVGRGFQENPGLVFAWAKEIGQTVQMPNQIRWGFVGRAQRYAPGRRPVCEREDLMAEV